MKIHHAQSLKDRIFLGYILNYLTRYQKDFKIYQGIYIGELYSCFPQYVVSLAFIITKLLLCAYMRLQADSSRHSVYRRGK